MDDFIVRALIAGFAVATVAGPLGAFVVWRRKAYFGDTLAHAALLGVALGLLFGSNISLTILAVCMAIAVLLVTLQRRMRLGADTLLGIMAHGGLSLGLVVLAFAKAPSVDLMSYLFGDILAVGGSDIASILIVGAIALAALAGMWRPLLSATVSEDLAAVEGVPVLAVNVALMLLLAVVVALAMKIVGILLVTALLIIPAAAARPFARTPEQMAALAALLGCAAVGAGLWGAFSFDTPAGPTIVVAALLLFTLASVRTAFRPRR